MTDAVFNPSVREIGIGAAGVAVGGAVGAIAGYAVGRRKTRKKSKRRGASSRKRNTKNRRRNGRRTPYTARKRPDTSRKRIRYTKNGQPYVIKYRNLNGRRVKMAQFIKKSSARRSHRYKGGRY